MVWKQVLRVSIVLLACLGAVLARVGEEPEGQPAMKMPAEAMPKPPTSSMSGSVEGSGAEAWLISFLDDAQASQFEAAVKYLGEHDSKIVESVNESYIKFLVANMTKADAKLLENKMDEFGIESVRLDDEFWKSSTGSDDSLRAEL